MKLHLHIKNKHERDMRVRFEDPTHTYYIDGDSKDIISSTTVIKKYFPDFDADSIVKNIVGSYKWKNDEEYKYYQMSAESIKKQWKDSGDKASKLGTLMHEKIEYFYNDNEVDLLEDEKEFEYFLNFYEDHQDMEIYRTEWVVYIDELKIAGSIDATFINEDGTLSLYDWKRSKEIKFDSFGDKTALKPFEHLPDCNFSKYSLQLNLYRRIIEDYYNFQVKDMHLVIFYPQNNNYIKLPVTKMDKEIDIIFKERKKYISKNK